MEIIYPPTLNWGWMRQRPQQLMRQFARHGHRVYYCNQYQESRPLQEVEPNLYVVSDCAQFVCDVVPTLSAPLVWCTWPKLHDTLDQFRPKMVVFDCIDRFPEWDPFLVPMVQRADVVITSSDQLHADMVGRCPRVHVIRNGCDYDHFAHASPEQQEPPDLSPYPRPRAGFVGAWAPWIDGALLDAAAELLPDWSWVMIGPYLGGPQPTAPNIHLLGMKPYARLPHYLQQFDVAIVPFQIDRTTVCADPIKLWEYLAGGLPVVSTPIPEASKSAPLVHIAQIPAQFAAAVAGAVAGDSPALKQARRELARSNSWEARYQEILRAIPELQQQKDRG